MTTERLQVRLKSEGEKTRTYFRSLSNEDWKQQVYTTGTEWNVHEILCHFVSAERAFHALITNILEGGSGTPQDFDLDQFNENETAKLEAEPIDVLLAEFEDAREATSQLVGQMAEDDLNRIGYHPWFGQIEIKSMLKLIYRHNMIHLRDVRKALETKHPVPHQEFTPPAANDKA